MIVPLYNKREHVLDTLSSVLAQSRPADEILVVDDGSTDGSGTLVEELPGVRLVRQENAGPSAARNHGIDLARGDVIAFLDADDRWAPGKLEHQLAFMESHPDIVWCACNHRRIRANGESRIEHPRGDEDWTVHEDWFAAHARRDRMLTSGVLVRRAVLRDCGGFDESIPFGQDGELWSRVALKHPTYGFCNRPLFDYLDVSDSVSKPGRRRFECRHRIARLHLGRSRDLAHASYRRYARRKATSVVRSALSHGESHVARSLALELFADSPSARSLSYLLLSRLPASLNVRLGRGWRNRLGATPESSGPESE